MVVTVADVEQELEEELARKNKGKKHVIDASWVPHHCKLVLSAGLCCSMFIVFLPQQGGFLSKQHHPSLNKHSIARSRKLDSQSTPKVPSKLVDNTTRKPDFREVIRDDVEHKGNEDADEDADDKDDDADANDESDGKDDDSESDTGDDHGIDQAIDDDARPTEIDGNIVGEARYDNSDTAEDQSQSIDSKPSEIDQDEAETRAIDDEPRGNDGSNDQAEKLEKDEKTKTDEILKDEEKQNGEEQDAQGTEDAAEKHETGEALKSDDKQNGEERDAQGSEDEVQREDRDAQRDEPLSKTSKSENGYQNDGHVDANRREDLHAEADDSDDTKYDSIKTERQKARDSFGTGPRWIVAVSCINGKSVDCDAACRDRGLKCDPKYLELLKNETAVKSAVKHAGTSCENFKKVKSPSKWDGPFIEAFSSGECSYASRSSSWKPSCTLAPSCGFARICPCAHSDASPIDAPKKFTIASEMPLMWWDVAAHVPKAIPGDWASETLFLDRVLRSFGRLVPGYRGPQRLLGFQQGKLFDEKGMFAFDDSVRSIAIDVGAATNPLAFDLPIDNSQVAFFVEPVQWKTIEADFERNFKSIRKKGGCDKNFDPGICSMERALVFPAAVSSELGHASFHATANPFCGSLEAFKTSEKLKKSKEGEVRSIYEQCYMRAGKVRKVPTISLKSIIERTPKHVAVKYLKIDAQGHDFKVLLSAGDQISRVEYVRFEMQVDPPDENKLVKGIPSYSEIKARLEGLGFKHNGNHACYFDPGASRFSKLAKEMECVFCRKLPCVENARPPLGPNPSKKSILESNAEKEYVRPGPWLIPVGMDTKESLGAET